MHIPRIDLYSITDLRRDLSEGTISVAQVLKTYMSEYDGCEKFAEVQRISMIKITFSML